jgi:hypothetical protein
MPISSALRLPGKNKKSTKELNTTHFTFSILTSFFLIKIFLQFILSRR